MGVNREDLLMTYQSGIRIMVEMNVPLWHFSITKKMSKSIEKVQKASVFIILGKRATHDYSSNLAILGLESLLDRRYILCKEFATKTFPRQNVPTEGRKNYTRRKESDCPCWKICQVQQECNTEPLPTTE